jgi:hypothetical protein
MGTKREPSAFDCYIAAEPDEPVFTLRGKDRDASALVKMWAFLRLQQIDMGMKPESDRKQVSEALHVATEMEIWHREYDAREKRASMEFDSEGYPTTGPHRRLAKNSTSGANDKD